MAAVTRGNENRSPTQTEPPISGSYALPVAQTFITTVLIVALGLLSGIQLARSLGPQGRGEVAAALLWPGLLVNLGAMGLSQAVVVFSGASDDRIRLSSLLSTAAGLALGLSSIADVAGVFIIPVVLGHQSPEVIHAARIFLLMIPAGMLSGSIAALLQGRCSFTKLNALRLIVPGGFVLGLAGLTATHRLVVTHIVLLQLGLSYLTLMVGYVLLLREGIGSLSDFDIRLAKQLLRFGSKAYVGILSGTLNQRLDQMLLAAFFPAAQLGIYSVAVSAAGATDGIGFAFRTVASGRIARQANMAEKIAELRKVIARFWPFLLSGTAALAVSMPKLIPLFYGRSFSSAALPAEVLLLAQVFYTAKSFLTSAAEAFGNSWLGSKAELLGLLPATILLIVLLPRFGVLGAAVASVIGCGVQFAAMAWAFHAGLLNRPQVLLLHLLRRIT